mmetsp:Transcript_5092/g.7371  ORF Transcript_5092/g.7371 Transcript_5092/m.7371 type:complete len:555 (+) Transcript_5092:72-1736(+)
MPLPGFQGIVNGWIKVNSKHVVIKKVDNEDRTARTRSSVRAEDRSTAVSSSAPSSQRPQADLDGSKNRRFKNKRKRRNKLERSVSLSDLLREMANKKNSQTENADLNNEEEGVDSHQETKNTQPLRVEPECDSGDESYRFVAGFFDQDAPPPPPPLRASKQSQRKEASSQKQKDTLYRNKNSGKRPIDQQQGKFDTASVTSRPSIFSIADFTDNSTPPTTSIRSTPPLHLIRGDESRTSRHSAHIIRGDDSRASHPTCTSKQSNNPMQEFFKNFPTGKRCNGCEEMEARLIAMHADIEYLRTDAVRSEFICYECRHKDSKTTDGLSRLSDASKRINDMATKQIEEMAKLPKDLLKSQQDLQQKMANFAIIAKDLNEELTLRNQDAIKVEDECMKVKVERDNLALEVESLRTKVSQYEIELVDFDTIKSTMKRYEVESLEQANKAIEKRDEIIQNLSTKLERALTVIGAERQQQRQRRQIIFPSRTSQPVSDSSDKAGFHRDVACSHEELRLLKTQRAEAQAKFEQVKAEARSTESAYKLRIATLEKELKSLSGS